MRKIAAEDNENKRQQKKTAKNAHLFTHSFQRLAIVH